MATTRKKPVPKKPTKKRPVKRTRKKPQAEPIVTPVITPIVAPAIQPIQPTKHIPEQPGSRLKLWLAVSAAMAVIVLVWAYSLSRTVFSSNAIEASLANSTIDEFMGSVSKSFTDLKTTSDTFIEQNQEVRTPPELPQQPSTEELDNLFSDIE
ncbi:MAG: hypothetical protein ACD_41C00046G0001 [uncultured bacterium]|nr:MAG: hypothetical protein ACD_41C00046G0001 [uncultured bacterium]